VVTPQDDENAVFDHWEDQSRDRIRTIVLDADAAIAACYDKNITATTPATNSAQDKGHESDEDNDDDEKIGDDEQEQKKEKKEKGDDNHADNDDDGGSSTPNGQTGSWLLPLEKGFEGFLQLIRSNSCWNL